MDPVDKAIILSLKQDLRILSDIVEEVARTTKDSDIKCWLFPTKDIRFFKQFIEEYKIFEDNNRTVYLELILDRFYVGTHLILSYIREQVESGAGACEKILFLHKPKQVTLGCSFDNLWKTIQQVVNAMASNKDISKRNGSTSSSFEIYNGSAHKSCQTDIVSLNRCDSCASAVSCMKNLLLTLENYHPNNYGVYSKMRPKLYNVTQFGCMLQTTSTVEQGLRNLYKKINDYENKIENMSDIKRKMEQDNCILQRKATFLEQQVKVYRDKQEKDSIKLQQLITENEGLLNETTIARKKLNENTKLIKQYVESLETHEHALKRVTTENINLKACYANISEELNNIKKESHLAQTTMAHLEQETKFIHTYLVGVDNMVEIHNKKLKNCSRISNSISEKVSDMTTDFKEESEAVFKNFREFKEHIMEKLSEIRSANGCAASFQITGNPAEDISKQIAANDEKIKALQNENQKLSIIVSKFNNK